MSDSCGSQLVGATGQGLGRTQRRFRAPSPRELKVDGRVAGLQLRTLKKNWLAWVILGGPVLVYAIGKLLNR